MGSIEMLKVVFSVVCLFRAKLKVLKHTIRKSLAFDAAKSFVCDLLLVAFLHIQCKLGD